MQVTFSYLFEICSTQLRSIVRHPSVEQLLKTSFSDTCWPESLHSPLLGLLFSVPWKINSLFSTAVRTILRFYMWVMSYDIGLSVPGLFHLTQSPVQSMLQYMLLNESTIPLYRCILSSLSILLLNWWTPKIFPLLFCSD